jgi:SSS family solute:Na+ symporter
MKQIRSRHCSVLRWLYMLPLLFFAAEAIAQPNFESGGLEWTTLPDLPDPSGVAGGFVGVHNDALIVAGGANFPRPVWDHDKQWTDAIHVLPLGASPQQWVTAGKLPRACAYGGCVATSAGLVCLGGNDSRSTFSECFVITWDPAQESIGFRELPDLPSPCAYGQATAIGTRVYLAGGQSESGLESAMANLWWLDLDEIGKPGCRWHSVDDVPWSARAFNLTVRQHNGFTDCIYVISGRRQSDNQTEFLRDTWEFNPTTSQWRQRSDVPRCVMAGTAYAYGQSHIFVPGGADGSLFFRTDELRDAHPGFPKDVFSYHTITDRWLRVGDSPANQVTTGAAQWHDQMIVASGEIRPRVRTSQVWSVRLKPTAPEFGALNYTVLFVYLASMVAVGVWFAKRNRTTDDYFRGGMQIPWWAAGCSIFATMLSSLTFTGIPSKAFAQDWVYAVGNFMIPVVAVLAVFVAMPFFRQIDATSAYEYLERRFDRRLRWFGSLSFTVFHVFRIAVVLSLTALALSVATPLTPVQSVLLMGVLSMMYSTLGGIEAVVWTDTIQTIVLLGGALAAVVFLLTGIDGGLEGFIAAGSAGGKFNVANLTWDPTNSQLALWVVIAGGIAQNISSYTADQAVVQRYMTTRSPALAARSIWTNAIMTIPATVLFFSIGALLFCWYQNHPERLEPQITTDQIFPLFIARELPIGLAGLIVAGIFAAAQSTVSTSMNSMSTAVLTDFFRPLQLCSDERGYLRAARWLTIIFGAVGTALGVVFVNPSIKSLFDTFIIVIGLFMGVLGGLFVLGGMTTRANAAGALWGALIGTGVMAGLWLDGRISGYLYTACGIFSCVVSGYVISLIAKGTQPDLARLTIHTLRQ